jgi:precorrin-6B methylase 2
MNQSSSPRPGDRALRKRQVELLSLAEGFFESRILFALKRLNIFDVLGEEERTAAEVAESIGAERPFLDRLLNAGVMLRLLEKSDAGRYRVAPQLRPLLVEAGGPAYLGDWLDLLQMLDDAMRSLHVAAVEGGPTVQGHAERDPEELRAFTMAMHSYAALRGRELARFLDTSECETLLDLGCGPGTYSCHLGLANPGLRLVLIDHPQVLETTREIHGRYPLKNDIEYVPLDITEGEIPGSYDLVLVSNTLHMLGETASRELLSRVRRHVNPGGSLVVQFQYMDEDRLGGRWAVILDLIQMCYTSHGKNHTVDETREWMESAGFADVEFCSMSLLNTNGFLRGYVG